MPPQQKSGISLALPRSESSSGSSQIRSQQQDLGASGMTGDDDSVLGREYVVVEKRNVEVNALADGESASAQVPAQCAEPIISACRNGCSAAETVYAVTSELARLPLPAAEYVPAHFASCRGVAFASQSSFTVPAYPARRDRCQRMGTPSFRYKTSLWYISPFSRT